MHAQLVLEPLTNVLSHNSMLFSAYLYSHRINVHSRSKVNEMISIEYDTSVIKFSLKTNVVGRAAVNGARVDCSHFNYPYSSISALH
jgi:hypothetical protein